MKPSDLLINNSGAVRTLVYRTYRLVGLTKDKDAPIFGCGSGFFIESQNKEAYFVLTFHQYRNLFNCKAIALTHHDDYRKETSGILIFDDLNHPDCFNDHIVIADLDIVLVPLNVRVNKDVRLWGEQSFWYLNYGPKELASFSTEIYFCGYPTDTNGVHLYENRTITQNQAIESSSEWSFGVKGIEIDATSMANRKQGMALSNGMSGGPIFTLRFNSQTSISVALLGVITHRSSSPPKIFGTSFFEIFDRIGIDDYA